MLFTRTKPLFSSSVPLIELNHLDLARQMLDQAQDASLRDLSLDLLGGGVAGFYRNDEGKLYVVSRSGGMLELRCRGDTGSAWSTWFKVDSNVSATNGGRAVSR